MLFGLLALLAAAPGRATPPAETAAPPSGGTEERTKLVLRIEGTLGQDRESALAALPDCPPHVHREAIEALAIHHEHRLRDPRTARAFAIRSLPLQGSSTRRQALQHRLARLDRKLDAHSRQTATLF